MKLTTVLGLGNLVHSDDGVGVHAIHGLQLDSRVPPGVVLLDGGTQGLALLPHIAGVDRLLVIDAIDSGEPINVTPAMVEEVRQRLRGRAAQRNPANR